MITNMGENRFAGKSRKYDLQKLYKQRDEVRQKYLDAEERHDVDEMEYYNTKFQRKCTEIARLETEDLIARAQRFDIVIPSGNAGWWFSDPESKPEFEEYFPRLLTEEGKAGALKLIKEESRANHDWWIKTVTIVVTVLIGLLGAITGTLSVYYQKSSAPQPCIIQPINANQ